MRLLAWRESWMWLAVAACGGPPTWMTRSANPKVSIFDAPPLAGASYVATVDAGDFGDPGPRVAIERGRFQCRQLVELLGRDRFQQQDDHDAHSAAAQQKCDRSIGTLLRERAGFVFVVDGAGPRWLSAEQVLAAALPIDGPAKALLAVWLSGKYDPGWGDEKHHYGSIEDGIVHTVAGGFEVAAGTRSTESNCGGSRPRQTVRVFRHTIFVDAKGALDEREKVETHRYDIADPCHPLGRRPEGFVDVTACGWLRAMHHEAESVRAFERIARELRAYGAPSELFSAAEQAARDERDHAERCARLAGVEVVIASDALPLRSLVDFAIDNACEGCVGESYAALVAVMQARSAREARMREHHAAIAADEISHAALAHAIAEWVDTQLTAAERARVRRRKAAAVVELTSAGAEPALLEAVAVLADRDQLMSAST